MKSNKKKKGKMTTLDIKVYVSLRELRQTMKKLLPGDCLDLETVFKQLNGKPIMVSYKIEMAP